MSGCTSGTKGLRLERFSAENADLVLSWRNAPRVRANSLSDTKIERAAHLEFVAGLAGRDDRNFFVLHEDGVPQAVLNVNTEAAGSALWGCYVGGDGPVRPGLFPVLIAVSGILAFDMLGCSMLHSEVLQDNPTPQKTNTFLGVPQNGTRTQGRDDGTLIEVLLYHIASENWPGVRTRMDKIMTKRHREMLDAFAADPRSTIF